jgi:hypothetical protein
MPRTKRQHQDYRWSRARLWILSLTGLLTVTGKLVNAILHLIAALKR